MAVETLRPNAAGDAANNTVTGTNNYTALSDNSDASYLRNNTGTDKEDDLNLGAPATVASGDTINSIDVRFRARSETSATGSVTVGLRLSGTNSLAAAQGSIPTSATDYTKTGITRPGGGSWTFADLANLQVVCITNDGSAAAIRLFEVYVDVNYTVGAVSIAPADETISTRVDATSITQDHVTVQQDIALATGVDATTITQNHVIVPQDIALSTTEDATTVAVPVNHVIETNVFTVNESIDTDPATGSKKGDTTYVATDGGYLRFQLAASFSAGQFEYTGDLGSVFSMHCDFWAGGGSGADSAFFYWGAFNTPTEEGSDQDQYGVVLNEFTDKIEVRYAGTVVASTPYANLDNSTWRSVAAHVNGDRIRVYVDGVLQIDVTDTTRTLGGTRYGWGGRSGGGNNEHRARNLRVRTGTTGNMSLAPSTDNTVVDLSLAVSPNDIAVATTTDNATISQNHALSGADVAISTSSDNATISQNHVAAPNDLAVSLTADTTTIAQNHVAAPADIALSTSVDATTITQTHAMTAQDLTVTSRADAVTISQIHSVTPADLQLSTRLDAATIAQTHTLSTTDIQISLATDNATVLETGLVLLSADLQVAAAADNTTITQTHGISPADLAITTRHDAGTVAVLYTISPADITITARLDNATIAQIHGITAADLRSTISFDASSVSQQHVLTTTDIQLSTRADAATLSQTHFLSTADIQINSTIDAPSLQLEYTLAPADLAVALHLGTTILPQPVPTTPIVLTSTDQQITLQTAEPVAAMTSQPSVLTFENENTTTIML